jgi:hypothetical protein
MSAACQVKRNRLSLCGCQMEPPVHETVLTKIWPPSARSVLVSRPSAGGNAEASIGLSCLAPSGTVCQNKTGGSPTIAYKRLRAAAQLPTRVSSKQSLPAAGPPSYLPHKHARCPSS